MLDILISLTGLILLSPVILVLAILVRIKLGSPVIFHQARPGYRERIFTLCKFRTMTDARDEMQIMKMLGKSMEEYEVGRIN